LVKYAIREKVKGFPFEMFVPLMDKYGAGKRHIDLKEKLAMKYGEYKSLDSYLQIYCSKTKETLGDEFFRNASDEDLKKHCLQDLELTEDLYLTFEPIFV
jgi:hypothetical protein